MKNIEVIRYLSNVINSSVFLLFGLLQKDIIFYVSEIQIKVSSKY